MGKNGSYSGNKIWPQDWTDISFPVVSFQRQQIRIVPSSLHFCLSSGREEQSYRTIVMVETVSVLISTES